MKRQRRNMHKFPTPDIDDGKVLEDIRNRDYLSKFKDFHVRTVFYLALLGMTEEQMAVVFDIPMHVFSSWKHKHPTFFEALKKGKEQADASVVYSLYQSAIGYEVESEKIFCSKEKMYDPTTGKCIKERPVIIRAPFTEKYPPNVKAAIKWLEVRQGKVWAPKQAGQGHPNVVVNQQNNFDLKGLSMEELQLLKKLGVGQAAPVQSSNAQVFASTYDKQLDEFAQ